MLANEEAAILSHKAVLKRFNGRIQDLYGQLSIANALIIDIPVTRNRRHCLLGKGYPPTFAMLGGSWR